MKQLYVAVSLMTLQLQGNWLAHDRAALAAQQGDWNKAQELLKTVMVHQPKNPAVLYDAGVAAYKLGEYENARAYFDAILENTVVKPALKKQTQFNLGNTYLALKNPEQALAQYEKILAVKPTDVPAQHNAEVARQMLQQKQQQEQQEKKDKQQQKQQQQQDDEKSDDQQQQSGSKDGQGEKQKSDKSKKQEQQEQQNEQSGQPSKQQEQADNEKTQEQSTAQQEQSNAQQREQEERQRQAQQDQQQGSDSHDDKQMNDAKNSQKDAQAQAQKGPANKADQKKSPQSKQQQMQAVGQQGAGKPGNKEVEAWVGHLLDEQEKKEADVNKQMIKMTVGKKMAGHDGQNCW